MLPGKGQCAGQASGHYFGCLLPPDQPRQPRPTQPQKLLRPALQAYRQPGGAGGGGVALPCASLYMWGGSGNAPAAAWGAAGLAGTIAWVSSRSSFDLVRNCNCSGPSVGQTSGLPVGWASGPASRRQQGHGGRDSVNWQTSGPMPLGFQPMPFGYSLRGHCRMERRKDRWFCNPKGIVSSSPATESARLPWVSARAILNPNDCVPSPPSRHNPFSCAIWRHYNLCYYPTNGTTTDSDIWHVL